jgi:hypothetical protein
VGLVLRYSLFAFRSPPDGWDFAMFQGAWSHAEDAPDHEFVGDVLSID